MGEKMKSICGCEAGVELKPYFAHGETDFHRCTGCGIVMRRPMPTLEELDEVYTRLYQRAQIESGTTDQESGAYALQQYARHLGERYGATVRRVLDYGSGSGELPLLLRRHGLRCDGVESSESARDWCRENRGIELLPSLAGVSSAEYDLVCMIEVIEHLVRPLDDLAQVMRVLHPGGSLFLTTPNRRGLRARIERGHWREAAKRFHVLLFDEESLGSLLVAGGFTRVRRVRFPPVMRCGVAAWTSTRMQQLVGLGGGLCMLAEKPRSLEITAHMQDG